MAHPGTIATTTATINVCAVRLSKVGSTMARDHHEARPRPYPTNSFIPETDAARNRQAEKWRNDCGGRSHRQCRTPTRDICPYVRRAARRNRQARHRRRARRSITAPKRYCASGPAKGLRCAVHVSGSYARCAKGADVGTQKSLR